MMMTESAQRLCYCGDNTLPGLHRQVGAPVAHCSGPLVPERAQESSCDHCHHGRADGVRVGWSPDRLVWEACKEATYNADRPVT